MTTKTVICLGALLCGVVAAQATPYSEGFEGFTAGASVGQSSDWSNFANQPVMTAGAGLGGGMGLGSGSSVFHWNAHPFNWGTDLDVGGKVIVGMDFKASSAGKFDDDRLGWTVDKTLNGSGYQMSVQLDSNQTNPGLSSYWRVGTVNSGTYSYNNGLASCAALSGIVANEWYRARAEFTKLTDTSARIDFTLVHLDALGNVDNLSAPISGTYADTSALGVNSAPAGYFTAATLWPTFKNYTTDPNPADNAYFEIIVPEPATLGLLTVGLLALLRRRR